MEQNQEKKEKLDNLVKLVNDSEISSIKGIVSNIIKTINDLSSTAKDLKDIIQIDPPLTAKILKLANSAYYSTRSKISEIEHAVIWVGYDAVKELALNQKVCEIFNRDESIEGYSRYLLWKNSIGVALLGKMIYRREFGEKGEDIYAAGLLRNIGIIAEDQFLQSAFRDTLKTAKNKKKNLNFAENEIFGFDHTEVGMAIATDWKFPTELIRCIEFHHNPMEVEEVYLKRKVYTLFIADYLCQENHIGYCDAPHMDEELFVECRKALKLERYALQLIVDDMIKELKQMELQGVF
ncbi:HDOD domain-containing protein [candidate division KSB1 bacterium]|nr:HDOD domain-containing protein [candidate division KSB1 bacterium]